MSLVKKDMESVDLSDGIIVTNPRAIKALNLVNIMDIVSLQLLVKELKIQTECV